MTVGGFSFIHLATPLNVSASRMTGCCSAAMSTPSCHGQSKCIAYAAALIAGGAVIGYIVGSTLAARRARCNSKVQLSCAKVADSVDIEDIGEKKAFCRCWKSDKWPYCDGSHNKHNKETGDNVGPLVIKGKPAAQ